MSCELCKFGTKMSSGTLCLLSNSISHETCQNYFRDTINTPVDMRPELKVIERDLSGFATEKSKADMYEALPIIVLSPKEIGIDYIDNSNWLDALTYIEIHTNMTHYFKCPDLKQLED